MGHNSPKITPNLYQSLRVNTAGMAWNLPPPQSRVQTSLAAGETGPKAQCTKASPIVKWSSTSFTSEANSIKLSNSTLKQHKLKSKFQLKKSPSMRKYLFCWTWPEPAAWSPETAYFVQSCHLHSCQAGEVDHISQAQQWQGSQTPAASSGDWSSCWI